MVRLLTHYTSVCCGNPYIFQQDFGDRDGAQSRLLYSSCYLLVRLCLLQEDDAGIC